MNETLAFAMKRDGIMYGNMDRKNDVSVEFICELPQQGAEVWQAAELHAKNDFNAWVMAVVKLEKDTDGGTDVHFEAFQLSDQCIELWKDGWFVDDLPDLDPKLSRINKDVVVLGKDTREVDNDFFLVLVKILDH